jgi:hypothetical protein
MIATGKNETWSKRVAISLLCRGRLTTQRLRLKDVSKKGERCRHYRIEVQRIFLNAEKDAKSDGQSNEEIKKIATEDLIPHWTEEGIKHTKAIEDSQTALDKCNERLEGKN